MREMRKHSTGMQHYREDPWDRLKREKIFAQWPLKGYLSEIEKLQKLTRDYWRARENAGNGLNTTKLLLGAEPSAGMTAKYEGMAARRITAGTIEAETQAFTKLTNEMQEMRKNPGAVNNGFTPTPFDLHSYTNSDVANSHKPQPIQNTTSDPTIISNLHLIHKVVQEIERFLKRGININSGFRTEELNNELDKSSTNSNHMYGYAADLTIEKKDHQKVMKWIKANMEDGRKGLPILNQATAYSTIIHVDVNPKGGAKNDKNRRYMQYTPKGRIPFVFED